MTAVERALPDQMILTDSRRLTGPNLLGSRPGAVMDVAVIEANATAGITAWRQHIRRMLAAVGWDQEEILVRRFPGGVSLAITAPVDALLAATAINEWALMAANTELRGAPIPDLSTAVARLQVEIRAEQKPAIAALRQAAATHRVTFLLDEDHVSVGSGTGVMTWPVLSPPATTAIDWSRVHDVPIALVTGSNGKTTTVRLLASIVAGTGRTVGLCCSDSVSVGDQILERGDWSGPGGARLVLRDRRTEVAILETARGGMLRRGLAVQHADAAIITNVAEDHFGEFGITNLGALAEAKMIVRRALGPAGSLVLNADDPELRGLPRDPGVQVAWFSLDPTNPVVLAHRELDQTVVTIEDERVVLYRGGTRFPLTAVREIPITLLGAARHNVANVLGATALAVALGLHPDAVQRGLALFDGDAASNPGRLNLFALGGVTVLVDFAHNPHGMEALVEVALSLPARRRLLILGQAGDRDDHAMQGFARAAWEFRPDRIILKEMDKYRRGRPLGETASVMRQEFLRLGASPPTITEADSEFAAVIAALDWAREGDLLLLPVHSERDQVLALLQKKKNDGWTPPAT